jgi:hypothetical protein
MSRARLNVYIEPRHARQLAELATLKRVSRSSLIATALTTLLEPKSTEGRDAVIVRRLDKLSAQCDSIDRDQTVLIETFALFLRHHFSITPPVPESHQDAARAQGRARFEQFVQQLARHLERGQAFVKDVGL